MFYCPRGFLTDFENDLYVETFTKELKKYVKEHKGFFFKIDPYILKLERDKEGKIVENGFNNEHIKEKLKKLGYIQKNSKITDQTLQATWMYSITLENRTYDDVMKDMDSKTRQMIRKNEKNGVIVREGTKEDIKLFTDIMDHTSERREFLSRPYSYYINMYEKFIDSNKISLRIAEIHPKEQAVNLEKELKQTEEERDKREEDFKNGKLNLKQDKFELRQKEANEKIERLQKSIKEFKDLAKEKGDVVPLGGIIYMIHGGEVLSLYGGAYHDLMQYQPFYTIHYEMIKYGIENGFKKYNFYGISGNLVPEDPLYGIYIFKKGFGGQVEELIGEYDYVIDKAAYKLYDVTYKIVHKLKKLKAKK